MTTYLIGCLLTFVLWVIGGRSSKDEITTNDVISALIMSSLSWVVFIPTVIGLAAYGMHHMKDIVLWRRKR